MAAENPVVFAEIGNPKRVTQLTENTSTTNAYFLTEKAGEPEAKKTAYSTVESAVNAKVQSEFLKVLSPTPSDTKTMSEKLEVAELKKRDDKIVQLEQKSNVLFLATQGGFNIGLGINEGEYNLEVKGGAIKIEINKKKAWIEEGVTPLIRDSVNYIYVDVSDLQEFTAKYVPIEIYSEPINNPNKALLGVCFVKFNIFNFKIPTTYLGCAVNSTELFKSVVFHDFGLNINLKSDGWYVDIDAGAYSVTDFDGNNYSSQSAFSKKLIEGESNTIVLDKTTKTFDFISTKSVFRSDKWASGSLIYIGTVFPEYKLFYMNGGITYKVNGLPMGINTTPSYNYIANRVIIPSEIYLLNNEETSLYKSSMFLKLDAQCDMMFTTMYQGKFRTREILNPTTLTTQDVENGQSLRVTLVKNQDLFKNVYKIIKVHAVDPEIKKGSSVKIMMIGDSLTHGNNGAPSSPVIQIKSLLKSYYSIDATMVGTFSPYGERCEGKGYQSFQSFAGNGNIPHGQEIRIHNATTTAQFENAFLFPATTEDKRDYPQFCFTNKPTNPSDPDGLSYADSTIDQKNTYHYYIFDFKRYLRMWGADGTAEQLNATPDVVTIALGTNDWLQNGVFDLNKTLTAMESMYSSIRRASADIKIVIVSSQNMGTTLQDLYWLPKAASLCESVIKQLDEWKKTDNKLYECPIFACGSRWLAYQKETSAPVDIIENNNAKVVDINSDVHVLDSAGSDGFWEYLKPLLACIVNVM